MLETLPRFPCGLNKKPLTPQGFYNAVTRVDHSRWPLVGVRTGRLSGIDVLDIDPEGVKWLEANRDRLPTTREHETARGRHLLFAHAEGVRNSEDRIGKGIDVRGEGGYFIYWPRQGFAVENAETLADWPDWLLAEVVKRKHNPGLNRNHAQSVVVGMGDNGLLSRLNPIAYRDHDLWLRLMMGACRAGIDREAFIAWSTSDPMYVGDGDVIRRRWDSIGPEGVHAYSPFEKQRMPGYEGEDR